MQAFIDRRSVLSCETCIYVYANIFVYVSFWFKFLAQIPSFESWSQQRKTTCLFSIAQSVCEWAFSLLANWCLRPPSVETCIQQKNTTCLRSIRKSFSCASASKLTTPNIYIAKARRESQSALKSSGLNAYSWLGTGCWVQVFSFILDSAVSLSAGIQSAGDLVSETLGSNPAFNRGRQLVSFRFKYCLPALQHRN